MREFVKTRVFVSRCIGFESVRWDGKIISSKFVENLKPYIEAITVCPEVEVGLGVPRDPIRLVNQDGKASLVQPATGQDLSEKMLQFTRKRLNELPELDGVILKSRSPSCGINDTKIFDSIENTLPLCRGSGFFGAMVISKFGHLPIEDEKRLTNPRVQEHFLTKLFTLADFRVVKESGSINKLIDFQARNKLLFTAYSQKELHTMGRIVANFKGRFVQEVIEEYQGHLWSALKKSPQRGTVENILTKAAGYFSSRLSGDEKKIFLDTVAKYKAGKLPLDVPLNLLKSWIIKFNEEYLMQQTFLEPYPNSLKETEEKSV
jgi:uncharacterized protein YbgA (DUF1722 family)/uncharacterized protein YbbK (DUF523 family)